MRKPIAPGVWLQNQWADFAIGNLDLNEADSIALARAAWEVKRAAWRDQKGEELSVG